MNHFHRLWIVLCASRTTPGASDSRDASGGKPSSTPETPSPSIATRARLPRAWRHRAFVLGSTLLLLIVLMATLAPWISPHDPLQQDLANRYSPPVWDDGGAWDHVFGTDQLGRDYLSRIFYGARVSLVIGIAVALLSAVIGLTLGLLGGYYGGRVDMVVSFLITSRMAMPVILVALAIAVVFGSSVTMLVLTLGCLLWDRYAVVTRATTQQLRVLDYVMVARAQGCSTAWILFREIFPNLLTQVVIIGTLEVAQAVILESALSFLGLGVRPPAFSWGLMISEAKDQILFSPWLITLPGLLLFILVLSINLVGDGLRDILTPDGR